MQQHEFIWLSKSMNVESVTQNETGCTTVEVRPGLMISHNYKKKDLMLLTFTEDNMTFIIPSKLELEAIYQLHTGYEDAVHLIRGYCDKFLSREEK